MNKQLVAVLVTLWAAVTSLAGAQFSSGSDGSDGALIFPASPTSVTFDPTSYDPPLDPDGDGVYHFTEIVIPAGVSVRVRADKVGWQPIYWLSQGDVVIAGTLNLNGENARSRDLGGPPMPGPGGFFGGTPEGSGGYGPGTNTSDGQHPSNEYLNPLTGGSGGRGGTYSRYWGGSGGGAILIASSTSVQVSGGISARGGNAQSSTCSSNIARAGAGGSVHILAPMFSGSGQVDVSIGSNYCSGGNHGWLRVESTNNTFPPSGYAGEILQRRIVPLIPEPLVLDIPARPSVRLVSVDGEVLPESPLGSFTIPDAAINSGEAVEFVIEAKNVPLGSVPRVYLFNTSTATTSFTTSELVGTFDSSVSVGSYAIPRGYALGWVWVDW